MDYGLTKAKNKHKYSSLVLLILLLLVVGIVIGSALQVGDPAEFCSNGEFVRVINGDWACYNLSFPESNNTLWVTEELGLSRFSPNQGGNPPQSQIIDSTSAVFSFGDTQVEDVYLTTFPINEWMSGSNFTIKIDWSPDNTNVGDVVWCVDVSLAIPNNGGFINSSAPKSTYCVVDSSLGIRYQALETDLVEVDGSGGNNSFLFFLRLYRDTNNASDTYSGDAHFLEGRLRYQMDKIGE